MTSYSLAVGSKARINCIKNCSDMDTNEIKFLKDTVTV